MSNLANFSPYKRSYQFMHLQNSVYHMRNKKQVKPMVKTNLKHSRISSTFDQMKRSRSQLKQSERYSQSNARLDPEVISPETTVLKQPYRVVHKNEIVNRAKSAKINHENKVMVGKLIDADCLIVSRERANQHYNKHRRYSNMIRKYQENGQRHVTPVINLKKVNPAIASYQSQRAQSAKQKWTEDNDSELFPGNWLG